MLKIIKDDTASALDVADLETLLFMDDIIEKLSDKKHSLMRYCVYRSMMAAMVKHARGWDAERSDKNKPPVAEPELMQLLDAVIYDLKENVPYL